MMTTMSSVCPSVHATDAHCFDDFSKRHFLQLSSFLQRQLQRGCPDRGSSSMLILHQQNSAAQRLTIA